MSPDALRTGQKSGQGGLCLPHHPQDRSGKWWGVLCLQMLSGQVRKAGWTPCLQARSSIAHLTEPPGPARVATAVVQWAQVHEGCVLVRTVPHSFPLARDTEAPTMSPQTNTLMPSLRSGCISKPASGILGCVSSVNVAALGPGVSQDPQDSPGQDHQGVVFLGDGSCHSCTPARTQVATLGEAGRGGPQLPVSTAFPCVHVASWDAVGPSRPREHPVLPVPQRPRTAPHQSSLLCCV